MASDESYITLVPAGASASGKTRLWAVWTADGVARLGVVSWFGRWRCYAFFPETKTVYERRCLRDIADFCESATRAKSKKAREADDGA